VNEPKPALSEVYLFGDFRFEVAARRLARAGEPVALTPKLFDLLLVLVRNAGRAVPRAELMDAVWRDTIVEEGNLAWNIKALRRALPDPDAAIVETVRGFGYRFALEVRTEPAGEAASPATRQEEGAGGEPDAAPAREESGEAPARPALGRRAAVAALGLVVLLAIAALVLRSRTERGANGAPAWPAGGRPTLAVLPPENLSGDPANAWISNAVREVISSELTADESVTSVAGETVARSLERSGIRAGGPLAPASLAQLRQEAGADLVVVGSYLKVGDGAQLRVDLHVQSVVSGERLGGWSGTGDERDLIALLARAGAGLRGALGSAAGEAAAAPMLAWKASNDALRLYTRGLEDRQASRLLEAKERFEQAVVAAPEFALAHAELARTLFALGYERRAAEVASRAVALSGGLSREERWRVEAQAAEIASDWPRATEIRGELARLFPDNLDYGLDLARALSLAGRHDDARAQVARLEALPGPKRGDPRIQVQSGWVYRRAGDFTNMHAAGTRAVELGKRKRMPLVEAEGRILQAWADLTLREFERGIPECEEAQRIAAESANFRFQISGGGLCAWMHRELGEVDVAEAGFRRNLDLARSQGNLSSVASNLTALAVLAIHSGRLEAGCRSAEESLQVTREAGQAENEANALEMLIECHRLRGELVAASAAADEGVEAADASGIATRIARLNAARGRVLLDRGDAAGAETCFRKAAAALGKTELGSAAGFALDLGRVALERGDLAEAGRLAEEVAEADPLGAATLRLGIARSRGDGAGLEAILPVLERGASDGASAWSAMSSGLARAEALAMLGREDEAVRALEALDRPEWAELGLGHLEAAFELARLRDARGAPEAEDELARARSAARAARFGRLLGESL